MTARSIFATRRPILLAALTLLLGASHAPQAANAASQGQKPQSSYQLISQALAAGQITDETAYKYRVFAAFGDARLPAQFRGDDRGVAEPPSVVLKAGMLLDTFSPQTQAELAPFFMSPAAPGSWVELRAGGGRDSFDQTTGEIAERSPSDDAGDHSIPNARSSANLAIQWHTVIAAGGRVKVWAQLQHAGDPEKADKIASEVTSRIWPLLVPVLGQPKSDMGTPNSSGGPELDIFLVRPSVAAQERLAGSPGTWLGLAMHADPTKCGDSAFMLLLDSRQPLGSETQPGMLQNAAHEIAHAMTGANPLKGECGDYLWMTEATATWAEHKTYPQAQSESPWAPGFLDNVSLPLPTNTPGGEYDTHGYASYLFPFNLQLHNKEGAISSIWTQFSSHDLRSGIDAGLRAVGDKLEEVFPKFAAENVNPETEGLYESKDRLTTRPPFSDEHNVTLPPGTVVYEKPIDLDIRYLATHYTRFELDHTVQMITFENTLVPVGHAGVHVVENSLGTWREPVDLTKQYNKVWCRDVLREDVQELIFVFTNNQWQDINRKVTTSAGYQPMLRAYPDPCGRGWTGTHTLVNTITTADPAMTIVETINSTIRFDVDSALLLNGQPTEHFKSVDGHISWRVQVTGTCTASASGGVPIPNLRDDQVASLRIWIEDGKRHHSGSNGPWPGDIPSYEITCPNGTSKMQLLGALGFFITDSDNDGVAVDGKSFSGRHANSVAPGITSSHSYSFRCSQRC